MIRFRKLLKNKVICFNVKILGGQEAQRVGGLGRIFNQPNRLMIPGIIFFKHYLCRSCSGIRKSSFIQRGIYGNKRSISYAGLRKWAHIGRFAFSPALRRFYWVFYIGLCSIRFLLILTSTIRYISHFILHLLTVGLGSGNTILASLFRFSFFKFLFGRHG